MDRNALLLEYFEYAHVSRATRATARKNEAHTRDGFDRRCSRTREQKDCR